MALSAAIQLLQTIKNYPMIFRFLPSTPILYCDHNATIGLAKGKPNSKTLDIDVAYPNTREVLQNSEFQLRPINSQDNLADILTKVLDTVPFNKFVESFNLHPMREYFNCYTIV